MRRVRLINLFAVSPRLRRGFAQDKLSVHTIPWQIAPAAVAPPAEPGADGATLRARDNKHTPRCSWRTARRGDGSYRDWKVDYLVGCNCG